MKSLLDVIMCLIGICNLYVYDPYKFHNFLKGSSCEGRHRGLGSSVPLDVLQADTLL